MGEIVARNVQWGDLYNRGDAAALTMMYAADAVLMTPAGDVAGAPSIQGHFAQEFAARRDTILASTVTTESVEVAGDQAYEAGSILYTLRARGDPAAASRGHRVRYVTFWQRTAEGRWVIRRSLRTP
jgi:ketosteroid isomerase-like protein